MRQRVISNYTIAVASSLLGLIALIAVIVLAGFGGDTVGLWVADVGSVIVTAISAAIILRTAWQYEPGESYRRFWQLIGIGVALYAVGDLVWAFYELSGADVPFPGIPDIFYFAEYGFLGTAMILAALAYRMLVDLRAPAIVSVIVSAGLGVMLWIGFLQPVVVEDTSIAAAEKAVSLAYPLADVFIAFAPALLLLLVIGGLSGGRLAWPWWPVAIGAVLLAASDTGYALAEATGSFASGSIIEYGWMAAHVSIAIGALIARDVARAPWRPRTS